MSKHTQGPWNYKIRDVVIDGVAIRGAIVTHVRPGATTIVAELIGESSEANARLIADAPELLEVAAWAFDALNAVYIQADVACVMAPEGAIYLRPVINALRQVIAKATG